MIRRTAGCPLRVSVAAVVLLASGVAFGGQVRDRYWELGVGSYFGGLGTLSELDAARFDWLYLCFGNIGASRETAELLNRLLAINPKLKIVIRLWPIMGLGDCPENRHQATFLHYLYKPGVKQKLLGNVHDQIRVVLDHIAKPENVVGLTFLEELPGHFSGYPFRRNQTGGPVTWAMERFRKEIEAERGKPLVWDDETRRWWAAQWIRVLNEIHAAMKKASGGRLVFYYQQTNHATLDMVPGNTPLERPMLIPIRWADVVRPGLCDGLFAYPNNRTIWNGHYVRFAKANNWLIFSQVSHPSGMRLCRWDECLELAKTRIPQNLGYFFYCSGSCAAGRAWNADTGIPPGPEWNTRGVSTKLHVRRHLALEDVGMGIVRRQPPLRLHADFPLAKAKAGEYLHPRVVVENTREASFFLDPKEAVAREAAVSLELPEGFRLDPQVSPPATLKLGHMVPGERRVADWWVSVPRGFDGKLRTSFVVTARAADSTPTAVKVGGDAAIPFAQPHEIGIPGTQWMEAAFRLPTEEAQPRIAIEALRGVVRNPSVGDGHVRIAYGGVLEAGMRLVLDPEAGARLFVEPLVDDDGSSRRDANDPSGFRSFAQGYLVIRIGARGRVDPAVPLRVRIEGKAEGGAQSLVVLRFRTRTGTTDRSILVNRFAAEWREASCTVDPPEGAVGLQNVFLYRFRTKGIVWYGAVKVERADAEAEGEDVSGRLRGSFPKLTRSALRMFSYRDDNPPEVRPRVRVQLLLPDAGRKPPER